MRPVLVSLLALLLLIATPAWAGGTVGKINENGYAPGDLRGFCPSGPMGPSPELAVNACIAAKYSPWNAGSYSYSYSLQGCSNGACTVTYTAAAPCYSSGGSQVCPPPTQGSETWSPSAASGLVCPQNAGDPSTGTSCTCAPGFAPSGGQCLASQSCQAKQGSATPKNVTIGWSRTNGTGEATVWDAHSVAAGANLEGQSACDGSCGGTLSYSTPGVKNGAYQSQTPSAQGLYRLSVDIGFTYTGDSCSQASQGMDTTAPPPACDGFVGQVNGQTTCVGKQGTTDTDIPQTTPWVKGNPAAGSDGGGGATLGSREQAGSTGGNDGGPARTDDGTIRGGTNSVSSGGTGNSTSPTPTPPKDPCGLPGTAPCKLDETGTPSAQGAYGNASTGIDNYVTNATGVYGNVTSGANSVRTLPWTPTALLLPAGGCTVMPTTTRFGVLTVDLCSSPLVALWRSLLGWLLAMFTVVYAWRSLTTAAGGK